jgi:hypothetical protein
MNTVVDPRGALLEEKSNGHGKSAERDNYSIHRTCGAGFRERRES